MNTPKNYLSCTVLAFCLSGASLLQAQTDKPNDLAGAIESYEQGEWEFAAQVIEELLESESLSGQAERTEARKYLGWNRIRIGDKDGATEAFKDLTREDRLFDYSNLSLEGEEPPPRVIESFGRAVVEVRKEEEERRLLALSQTDRGQAALRSAAIPGWGQRYQGYKGRSYAMLVAAAGAAAWAITADRSYRTARVDYDDAGPSADFDGLFSEYSNKSDTADLALGVFAAAWALNLLDAASSKPNVGGLTAMATPPIGRGQGMHLALVKRF